MATTLADILMPALRIAGLTPLPGTIPSTDQYGELIPAMNRMMSSYNLDGHKIYTSDIVDFPLVAGQKSYTIGLGGDFNIPRPIYISNAAILYPTSPTVRQPVYITLEEGVWMSIEVQDVSGAPPRLLYYDGDYSLTGTLGLANIYLYPQPPSGYRLELATWTQLKDSFTSVTDAVVLPPGYEEMMVWNFALRVAAMYPLEAKLFATAAQMARESLSAVQIANSKCPDMVSEAANLNRRQDGVGAPYGWWKSGLY